MFRWYRSSRRSGVARATRKPWYDALDAMPRGCQKSTVRGCGVGQQMAAGGLAGRLEKVEDFAFVDTVGMFPRSAFAALVAKGCGIGLPVLQPGAGDAAPGLVHGGKKRPAGGRSENGLYVSGLAGRWQIGRAHV